MLEVLKEKTKKERKMITEEMKYSYLMIADEKRTGSEIKHVGAEMERNISEKKYGRRRVH